MIPVYLTSPLGFSPEWKSCLNQIKRRLNELGCTVSWTPGKDRSARLRKTARIIASVNDGVRLVLGPWF
jgi:hypothetical protein